MTIGKNRHSFAKSTPLDLPDFLEIQITSFRNFLQLECPVDKKSQGLYKRLKEYFPITDAKGHFVLDFLDYYIDPPKFSIAECLRRGLTYSVPLRIKFTIMCNDPDHIDFETKTSEVYIGDIPYMTPTGTFVINGVERVVVSQLHRSPGVFFGQSIHNNGSKLYSARVIPFKGSWIEFSVDINRVIFAYIERKKKLPLTTLLRAIGYETDKDLLDIFGLADEVRVNKSSFAKTCKGRTLAARVVNTWHQEIVDEDTGELTTIERNEVLVERGAILDDENISKIVDSGQKKVLLHKDTSSGTEDEHIQTIYNTLAKDPSNSKKEAIDYVYRVLRGTDPADDDAAVGLLEKLFFSESRYSLGEVGRYKLNKRLGSNVDEDCSVLTKEDIIDIAKHLVSLIKSSAEVDDIDHLSNRRLRTVGEQISAQFGVGLSRMARTVRERMNVRDSEVFGPADIINSKTLTSVLHSFFSTSQLVQFMDQTNLLSEVTHKRRLTALGPGGLSRERAGFEVRDVHYTHYGRLCPIETPEGPNIGLISSLCVFAKVNSLGFIETPYRKVINGKIDFSQLYYLTAEQEDTAVIAQANAPLSPEGAFVRDRVKARKKGDIQIVPKDEIDYMDVAPNQIASISASLIPFLEHNDANRALMGSNMMRQAVPLLSPESPIVGTGMESYIVRDSGVFISAEADGEVVYADAKKIEVVYDYRDQNTSTSFMPEKIVYDLVKMRKTNQGTTVNLRPMVKRGDRLKKGQVLTDGYSTQGGELALGRNLLVAFMPWKGYNFEDAIVISDRVVREDFFTSVHVEEFSVDVRETKLGAEEITSEIPNVGEEATRKLDDHGMVMTGFDITPGDIIVGKITPKGEADPNPEERLLRAIFGDKAGDVKDISLKAPPAFEGTVISTDLFERKSFSDENLSKDMDEIRSKYEKQHENLFQSLINKLSKLLLGRVSQGVFDEMETMIFSKKEKYTVGTLKGFKNYHTLPANKWTLDTSVNEQINTLVHNYRLEYHKIIGKREYELYTIKNGDNLAHGVLKLAKVRVAKKRKLKVGDKMAGRHGNKGIVSKIVRQEDMPFLDDGTPVDIVLNPLGVPSRMNLGQIYETVLGWCGKKLGTKYATPIFDGASIDDLNALTDQAKIPRYGHTYLYDGGTGERFDQKATVGVIYMLKLGHLVDDKMHARSTGPYSLITQQPLGGKSQNGGQRFGEMEVWALEAFGAANILRELITFKSDDKDGRSNIYKALVSGEAAPSPGTPESFNVLLHELAALCLDVRFEK